VSGIYRAVYAAQDFAHHFQGKNKNCHPKCFILWVNFQIFALLKHCASICHWRGFAYKKWGIVVGTTLAEMCQTTAVSQRTLLWFCGSVYVCAGGARRVQRPTFVCTISKSTLCMHMTIIWWAMFALEMTL
jgi:hypothetical protein